MVLVVVRVSSQHHDHAKEHGEAGEDSDGGEAKGTPVRVLRARAPDHRLGPSTGRHQAPHRLGGSQGLLETTPSLVSLVMASVPSTV